MSWEQASIFTTDSHTAAEGKDTDNFAIKRKLSHFLRTFNEGNISTYRDQIQQSVHSANPHIEVSLDALSNYDQSVGNLFFNDPDRCLIQFEAAATEFAKEFFEECPPIQILLTSSATSTSLRTLSSSNIGKLVVVPGLVISTSSVTARATEIVAECSSCKSIIKMICKQDGYSLPRQCQRAPETKGGPVSSGGKCPLDPYVVLTDQSKFTDFQYLKIQESPEDVPPGEMPRHISATVDRALANSSIPGSRHLFIAVYSMVSIKDNIQKPVMRIVGLMKSAKHENSEERVPTDMFQDAESVAKAIAPEIYGMDDVKKAIAAQLFGGVRKVLPDSTKLRGDINVLLFGDPSVAKSQLLKFTQKVAPIGIYTSGKGSSAAGLTASVIRRPGGEFYLEGGAMVLADGGIVCIDEFDKMRLDDRVAIHEAMEQQTISIAKAGITAVLNTRTAVLAAANPIYGRFDDLKSARDNIDFQTTILSRFDLIFVLKDTKSEERDRKIAEHVLKVHSRSNESDTGFLALRKYISQARQRCRPVISEAAMKLLQSEYVHMRSQVDNKSSIPITVRQLEALIRVTEALAKMELADECKEKHVTEAIRMFKISTFEAAQSGIIAPEGPVSEEQKKETERIERYINRRCPLNSRIVEKALLTELQRQNYSDLCITRVLQSMLFTGQFEYQNQRRVIKRVLVSEKTQ